MDIRDRRNVPPPGDIGWAVSYWRRVVLRGRDMNLVLRELEKIKAMYQVVIDRHAGTPWEAFARNEMRGIRGYAIVPWSRSRGGGGLKGEPR